MTMAAKPPAKRSAPKPCTMGPNPALGLGGQASGPVSVDCRGRPQWMQTGAASETSRPQSWQTVTPMGSTPPLSSPKLQIRTQANALFLETPLPVNTPSWSAPIFSSGNCFTCTRTLETPIHHQATYETVDRHYAWEYVAFLSLGLVARNGGRELATPCRQQYSSVKILLPMPREALPGLGDFRIGYLQTRNQNVSPTVVGEDENLVRKTQLWAVELSLRPYSNSWQGGDSIAHGIFTFHRIHLIHSNTLRTFTVLP